MSVARTVKQTGFPVLAGTIGFPVLMLRHCQVFGMSMPRPYSACAIGMKRSLRYPLCMIDQSLIAKVISLSPAERLELIGRVWDSLAPEDIPVTAAEEALLDARIADMERNPADQSPWPDVKTRLEQLLR